MYFAFTRMVYRGGPLPVSTEEEFAMLLVLFLFLAVVAGLIVVPLSAWIMRQFLKLFRKRLTVAKLMNIGGYALVPRIIVAILATLLGFFNLDNLGRPAVVALLVVGALATIYSVFLYTLGIVVSPSQERAPA